MRRRAGRQLAGRIDDQRRAGRLFPERRLGDVIFVADMIAVIAPEHDNCVFAIRAAFERIQNVSHASIREGTGREVALHGLLPLAVAFDDAKFLASHRSASGRNVLEVVFEIRRQLDLIERVHVEVFPRRVPLQVRPVDSACEKERLVVATLQEFRSPLGRLPVGRLLGGLVDRRPVHQACENFVRKQIAHAMPILVGNRRMLRTHPRRILLVPRIRVGPFAMRLMVDLAAGPGDVSLLAKILRNGDPVLQLWNIAKPVPVAVDPGRRRPQPGHNRRTRRMAQWSGTIRLFE